MTLREWKRQAAHSVRGFLGQESADPERYHVHIEQTHATPGILQSVRHFAPDLLVIGTHGGGRLRRALVGSVANRVLHETTGDVLIVPQGSHGMSRAERAGMEVKHVG